jgi:hypothetical protein
VTTHSYNTIYAALPSATSLEAWEPQQQILITCWIFDRHQRQGETADDLRHDQEWVNAWAWGRASVQIWVERTYRVFRNGSAWKIDPGDGGYFDVKHWCASHNSVVSWFLKMSPRRIEVVID